MTAIATVNQILSAKKCGDLFPKNKTSRKELYHRLLQKYHPDVYDGAQADELAQRINTLYERADKCDELGIWEESNKVYFTDEQGKKRALNYQTEHTFGLGKRYISQNVVAYEFEGSYEQFGRNAAKYVDNLTYKTEGIQQMMEMFLPKIKEHFKTDKGTYVVVFSKTPDVYCLGDILKYFGGNMPPVHAAWVITRTLNFCCYMQTHGLVHNGITIDNIFVSPEYHSVIPIGGWWSTVERGEPILGIEKEVYSSLPKRIANNKIGHIITDIECLRYVARKLLGGEYYTAPEKLRAWIEGHTDESAVNELYKWESHREAAFGARKFIPLEVSDTQIYK